MSRIIRSDENYLVIDLLREKMILSTAACPKIYETARYIIYKKVPKDFGYVDLNKYCEEVSSELGFDRSETIIFLTATDITKYIYEKEIYGSAEVEIYTTIGLEHPSCLGEEPANYFGTINVSVITDKKLNKIGIADLFRLVSEIKGLLLGLGGPLCLNKPSVGTASDATLVASVYGEDGESFSGPATDIGVAVSRALSKALGKYLRKIPLNEYVKYALGFGDLETLLRYSLEIYDKAPIPNLDKKLVENELRDEYRRLFKDPNILALIRGIRLLEMYIALNLLPFLGQEEYVSDSQGLVIDELLGKSLAEYINGFKGLLAYYWVDRLKKNMFPELNRLPPLTDDLVASLIGSVLSRLYDRYTR